MGGQSVSAYDINTMSEFDQALVKMDKAGVVEAEALPPREVPAQARAVAAFFHGYARAWCLRSAFTLRRAGRPGGWVVGPTKQQGPASRDRLDCRKDGDGVDGFSEGIETQPRPHRDQVN